MVSNNALAAPVASAATVTVTEGGSLNINLASYIEGSFSSVTIGTQPNHSTGTISGSSFTYTHNGGEAPTDSFTFSAKNGDGDESNTATISIKVTAVNDAPTIAAIAKTVNEGSSVEITVLGADAEGQNLTYAVTSGDAPSYGTITQDVSTGVFTYTHNGSEQPATDTFRFTATEETTTINTSPLSSASSVV